MTNEEEEEESSTAKQDKHDSDLDDKSLSSGSDGSSYQGRASEMDDDEEDDTELAQKRKHYLKQRYSLQKVSVDGSNSHHSHALSNSKSGNRGKTKQNDTQRANQSENITRPEKNIGTPVRHQQIPDSSKATKPSTPHKCRMFLEDAPFLEVLELMKAQMKVTIDKKLFWNIKFYESQEDSWNVVGYAFHDIKMNGTSIRDKLERTQVLSAACGLN